MKYGKIYFLGLERASFKLALYWTKMILITLLLPVFYVIIFLSPFVLIDKILAFSSLYEIIKVSMFMIFTPIFYLMLLFDISIKSFTISDYKDSRTFIKFIKENFSILVFPFNKLLTDRTSIHFIIGIKGLFIYSEFETLTSMGLELPSKYTYRELSEKGYIDNNAFRKLLSASCKKKIFELAKKYYGS